MLRQMLTGLFLFFGCFFIVIAAIGVVRFPDFFSRIHAAGKADTMGQILVLTGLMIYEGMTLQTVKLLFIVIFILIVNPTATHALAKAAFASGVKPWTKKEGTND